MRRTISALAALLHATLLGAIPPSPPASQGLAVQAQAGVAQGTRSSRGLVPVCNNAVYPNGVINGSSFQYQSRRVFYCPDGIKSLTMVLAGAYANANTETDTTGAVTYHIRLEIAPAAWVSTKSYAIGDQVSWYPTFTGSSSNPIYTAVNASLNSIPGPGNTDWSAGAAPTTYTVTCGGQIACVAGTVTSTAGTTVTQGYIETDPWAAPYGVCTTACFVAVRTYALSSGGVPVALGQHFAAGGYLNASASQTDLTASGYGTVGSAISSSITPALMIGVPARNVTAPTVCAIGDSIPTGATGVGVSSSGWSISAGGTGYTSADVGKLVAMGRTGGTAGAVGDDAQFVIMLVSGGAVTGVRLAETGSYNNVTTNPSQTLPTGTQALTGSTVGTGLTLTGITYVANGGGYDPGARTTYAQGYIQRGLAAAGVRYAAFVSPGDAELGTNPAGWANRDYNRMFLVGKSGCTSGIIQLGINSITAGFSAAQIETADLNIASDMLGRGVKAVYQTTLIPFSTSTDGQATLANQTVPATDATVRQPLNAWKRSIPAPFAGVIDVAAALEDGGASAPTGKFIVNGTAGYVDIDSKHLTKNGHVLGSAPVQAYAPLLR